MFATLWGKCGWFGPLAVHPSLWDQGLAKQLLARVFAAFEAAGAEHVDLFTFTHSLKHHHLYRSFGCQPALLTYIMERKLQPQAQDQAQEQARLEQEQEQQQKAASASAGAAAPQPAGGSSGAGAGASAPAALQPQRQQEQQEEQQEEQLEELPEGQYSFERYAALDPGQQQLALQGCAAVTAALHAGLDCCKEVQAVALHGLGDTLLVREAGGSGRVAGFAVLHHGERTEAAQGVGGAAGRRTRAAPCCRPGAELPRAGAAAPPAAATARASQRAAPTPAAAPPCRWASSSWPPPASRKRCARCCSSRALLLCWPRWTRASTRRAARRWR